MWHAKNTYGYTKESQEAIDNATEVASQLLGYGWVLIAVCAALGNQEGESNYNPWRWQSEDILSTDSPWIDQREPNVGHAYGLFQQDPAGKYIHRPYAMALPTYAPNFSNQAGQPYDGNAQVNYLHWICSDPNGGEWESSGGTGSSYKMPYSDFITNAQNKNIEFLTRTFFYGYERGTWGSNRVTAARYWYNYFSENPPEPTPQIDNSAWFGVFHLLKRRKSNLYAQPRKRGGNFWRCLYRFKLKTLLRPALRRTAL